MISTEKRNIRLVICVEYCGNSYFGWQKQNNFPSIQSFLENVLFKITKKKISIYCASRTDAKVNAINQIAHFDTYKKLKIKHWLNAFNYNLPKDILVKWIKKISKKFHSRYSAISRRYCYLVYNDNFKSPVFQNNITYINKKLNINKIIKATKYLIGKKDFSSFHSSKNKFESSVRNIHFIKIIKKDKIIIFDIKANSFVRHMIRNIVGCLIEYGKSKKKISWIKNIILNKNRNCNYPTAKPNGLYLTKIYYKKKYLLPSNNHERMFFFIK